MVRGLSGNGSNGCEGTPLHTFTIVLLIYFCMHKYTWICDRCSCPQLAKICSFLQLNCLGKNENIWGFTCHILLFSYVAFNIIKMYRDLLIVLPLCEPSMFRGIAVSLLLPWIPFVGRNNWNFDQARLD